MPDVAPPQSTKPAPAQGAVSKDAPSEKASEEGEETERVPEVSPREERFLSGLPFFFGGGLAVFFAYELRDAPAKTGVPPLWVLFLTLGVIALVAGLLLVVSTEPEDDEDEEGRPKDSVVVPRKDWEKLQGELQRLRGAKPSADATPASESPSPSPSPPAPAPTGSSEGMGKAQDLSWEEGA